LKRFCRFASQIDGHPAPVFGSAYAGVGLSPAIVGSGFCSKNPNVHESTKLPARRLRHQCVRYGPPTTLLTNGSAVTDDETCESQPKANAFWFADLRAAAGYARTRP